MKGKGRMKVFWLILFASFGAHAGERYATDGDLLSTMDAYARAANLQPLKRSDGDSLRVWSRDYMLGAIEGYAISEGNAIKCRTTSDYLDGVISIERARCRRWHKGTVGADVLDGLAALDGRQWNCPLMDGGETYIEGVRNGRRFALRVGNADACDDADSKTVVHLLRKVWP
jgi:hypothetical protein